MTEPNSTPEHLFRVHAEGTFGQMIGANERHQHLEEAAVSGGFSIMGMWVTAETVRLSIKSKPDKTAHQFIQQATHTELPHAS